MAKWVIAVVGAAPCQCFSPGANQITSPGRISSIGPPHRCARPPPERTTSVCPSGCVCHAVRAPGSKVTLAPTTRAGSGALNSGSTRTVPANQSAGPFPEGWDPLRLISIACSLLSPPSSHPDRRSGCSEPGHLLKLLRIPRAFDCYLRRSVLNLLKVVGRKLNRNRSDVLFQPMQLRCARDRNNPRLLRQQPREGNLSGRCILVFSNLCE